MEQILTNTLPFTRHYSVCIFEGVAFSDFLSADVFKVDIWEIFNFEILMQYYQARPANNWQRGSLSDNLELKNWVSLSCLNINQYEGPELTHIMYF